MSSVFRIRRAVALLRVEMLQLAVDRSALLLIFGLPIMQILLYGYGVRFMPRDVPVAVASDSAFANSALARALTGDPVLLLTGPVGASGSARAAVAAGRALVGLELTSSPTPVRVKIFVDGADPATVAPAAARLQLGVWRKAAQVYGAENAPEVETLWVSGRSDRDAWAVAPGLVGVVIMVSMLFLGAMSLVRERERGTWESLLSTPIRPAEALLGKLTPYLLIGVVEAALLLEIVHGLFGVPLPWTSCVLVLASPLLAAGYLVLGFVFSALAKTQLQAVQGAVAVYLPSLLLSGFLFPFSGMPSWAKGVGEILPLTHYLRLSRALLLRSSSAASVLPELIPMTLFAVAAVGAAVFAFRRRLD